MEYIYVVVEAGSISKPVWYFTKVDSAYISRMAAFRRRDELKDASVFKTRVVQKKFNRADFEKPVPKKIGRSVKRKKRK